jgi:hypothetical protein
MEHSPALSAPTRRLLDDYMTRRQLAREFSCTERTISRWMALPDGLPHTRIGARTLFRAESVRTWLDSREVQPNQRRHTARRQGEAA